MSCDFLPRLLALLEEGPGRGVLLSGSIGAGKTRCAERLASELKAQGVSVGGVIQPRFVQNGETAGYTVRDLASGVELFFATLKPPGVAVGKYFVKEESISFALRAIEWAAREARVLFVDEIGRLELAGEGHAEAVRAALESNALPVLVVRTEFVDRVARAFLSDRSVVLAVEGGGTGD